MAKKILLVDDDELIRTIYKRQFDISGFETDVTATGAETLAAIPKTKYDLILLDILLPDMNGLDVLKKIKEDGINKDTTVVLLTNLSQDSVIQKGLTLGAKSYLIKSSYSLEQMVKEIQFVLDQPN